MDLKAGYFSSELDGFTIRVKDKKTIDDIEHLYDVLIYDHTGEVGNRTVITADEGVMTVTDNKQFIELQLMNGVRYTEEQEKRSKAERKYPMSRLHFKENLIRFDLSQFQLNRTEEELFKSNYRMLNMRQLVESIDTLKIIRKKHFEKDTKAIKGALLMYGDLKDKADVSRKRPVDIDSLYDGLSAAHKRRTAITSAYRRL